MNELEKEEFGFRPFYFLPYFQFTETMLHYRQGLPVLFREQRLTHWKSETEKVHGRSETRTCMVIPVGNIASKDAWEGLKSIARISRDRIKGDHASHEIIYYITSLKPNAALIADTAREHWGVENGLHWRLDVVFRQDKSHYRDRVGASNLAAIYKMALNALLQEDSLKKGVATKQCAAACNPVYRTQILKKLF